LIEETVEREKKHRKREVFEPLEKRQGLLSMKDLMLLAGLLAPTCLIALVAWWFNPRLWWESIGVLVTGAGIVLYLPIRAAFDPQSVGFWLFAEFVVIGSCLGVMHLALLGVITLLSIEKYLERRKAAQKLGEIDELPSND
jgi:hypothetical protein